MLVLFVQHLNGISLAIKMQELTPEQSASFGREALAGNGEDEEDGPVMHKEPMCPWPSVARIRVVILLESLVILSVTDKNINYQDFIMNFLLLVINALTYYVQKFDRHASHVCGARLCDTTTPLHFC